MIHEEPDTCRICSAPAESDAPLFHPCKCSGTIRYIHQDCLTTWLAHSKKKSCDVCKYQYTFTKVYSENMPRQIPFILFLRKFAQKAFWALVLGIRGVMVATIWLAFLPYVTVWTWRFYFIMGENIAWYIYDHPRPNTTPVFHSYFTNLTLLDDYDRTNSSDRSFIGLVTSYPIWRALSADIFTGQIIASLIVLVFLGIFLLREWIIQNARPGVFEEEELPDAEAEAQEGIEVNVEARPVNDVQVQQIPGEHNENHVVEEAIQGAANIDPPNPVPNGETPAARRAHPINELLGRKRRYNADEDRDDNGDDDPDVARPRRRRNRRIFSDSEEDEDYRDATCNKAQDEDAGGNHPEYEFTFRADQTVSTSRQELQRFSFSPPPESADLFQYQPSSLPVPFAPENSTWKMAVPLRPRPPPLHGVDLSVADAPEFVEGSAGPSSVNAPPIDVSRPSNDPLPSPSLASYQAPEQLDIGGLSSAESKAGADGDDDSRDSERESASSSIATVADSIFFREELDEYFPEQNDAIDQRQGPIPVEELLDDEEMLQDEPNPDVVPEEPEPVDAGEDQDAINDDDVDGALEAVGMRGPLTSVFQNAALMIFVLDTTIGLAVWLPFTVGKTTSLLLLEPIRILQLLHWPIRVIRYATDPLVDFLALAFLRGMYPVTRRLSASRFDLFEEATDSEPPVQPTIGIAELPKVSLNMSSLRTFIAGNPDGRFSILVRGINHAANSPIGQLVEPQFAHLGRAVRLNADWIKAGWVELANGDATVNRIFAIALGYLIAAFLLAIYLNVLNVGNVQSAGRAIRNAIRQQLIVLKVATFIVIELAVFPLGCGIMLDFCTLQLFPDASVQSRLSFFAYAPMTVIFYHWIMGTMFMYQFAMLLGGCRKIMRPGGLWFIKDPQDQSFHPIRDILDRPTLLQVRKLTISAIMYSFVVALGIGGLVTCLRFWGRFLLPLRWKLREPLSNIPIDLLFLHIAMPATLKYFRPQKVVFVLAVKYWKWAARQLRITSYMFGGMHAEEMRPSKGLQMWLPSVTGSEDARGLLAEDENSPLDGSFLRVPAQDNISFTREIRATVAVDKDGNPLDEAGRRLIEFQNSEADKAKRRAADDYTVVYVPPRFRERITAFIISLWIVGSVVLVTSLVIPTLLGRAVFSIMLGREVHDGYSIILGFYLLWGCYHGGMLLDRLDKRRQRSSGSTRGGYAVYVFKRAVLWIGNALWVSFWFGIVIPTLLALVIEVYLVHPLRLIFNPTLTLRIRIVDSWAIGLIYTKMTLYTMRLRPETRLDTAIKEMKEHGWRRLDAVAVTLDIIAPVTAGLLGMLLLPILLVFGLQHVLPTKISSNTLCQSPLFVLPKNSVVSLAERYLRQLSCPPTTVLYVYPSIFVIAGLSRLYATMQTVFASWAQQIRDTEFLVEMRLRNLDPPSPKVENGAGDSNSSAPVQPDGPKAE